MKKVCNSLINLKLLLKLVFHVDMAGAEAVSRSGLAYLFRIVGLDGGGSPLTLDLEHGGGAIYSGGPGSQFCDADGPVAAGGRGEAGSLQPLPPERCAAVTVSMTETDLPAMLPIGLGAVGVTGVNGQR